MTRRLALRFAIASAGLSFVASARADDTSNLAELLNERVITTSSTTAVRASTAPATSVTITAEELHTFGVRTLAEAIDYFALGVATENPLGSPDIGARGVLLTRDNGKHFLLLVNGHAINDPLYGAARFDQGAGIPIQLVDQIEITVGPGSVLYGSNAMLGVINVITKRAASTATAEALGEYEPGRSYHAGAAAGVPFQLFGAASELTVGVDYYERFGPDLEFDERQYTFPGGFTDVQFRRGGALNVWGGTLGKAYFARVPSGLLRLRSGDFDVSLMASSYRRGIPYAAETLYVDFDDPDSYERDHAVRLDVKHVLTVSALVELSSRIYADAFGYQRLANGVGLLACLRGSETCTYHDVGRAQWLGMEERVALNWLGDFRFVTTLGADVRLQRVQTKQDQLDFATREPFGPSLGRLDDSATMVAPYLQQTWSPTSWLELNGGARLDIDSRFDPVLSPRGAVAVRASERTTYKAIYSEAFRAPTWSETSLANYRVAPARNLKPETVHALEASVEQRFYTQRLFLSAFRSWWDNLIEVGALSAEEQTRLQNEGVLPLIVPYGLAQYRNVASMDNYGVSASYDGSLADGALRYGISATEAFTRRKAGARSEPLPVAPRFFGNVRIAYAPGGLLPTPALALSYVGSRLADRPIEAGEPILEVSPMAQIRLTLTGGIPALTGLSYRLSGAATTSARGPYAAGPNLAFVSGGPPIADAPPLGYAPIDQFNAFIGLKYELGSEETP
jgi:outer membrane receptor for ferrienterochelin and colicin